MWKARGHSFYSIHIQLGRWTYSYKVWEKLVQGQNRSDGFKITEISLKIYNFLTIDSNKIQKFAKLSKFTFPIGDANGLF